MLARLYSDLRSRELRLLCFFFLEGSGDHRVLHSFPTRRSSDLWRHGHRHIIDDDAELALEVYAIRLRHEGHVGLRPEEIVDRKSTRLNSSHGYISYAVFCLKKKMNITSPTSARRDLDHGVHALD